MIAPIIHCTEEGAAYLKTHPPSGPTFNLNISDAFTFAGKPDKMGAGMAILLDQILGAGYEPNGFEQNSGFRVYRYKKMQE
jgi:hypothetical protein